MVAFSILPPDAVQDLMQDSGHMTKDHCTSHLLIIYANPFLSVPFRSQHVKIKLFIYYIMW